MQSRETPQWIVMKFGGTSVSSVECWKTICAQAARHAQQGRTVLVVVSALSGVTNLLTRLADGVGEQERQVIRETLLQRHSELLQAFPLAAPARFSGYFENLLGLIDKAGPRCTDRDKAELLAHGELLSSSIGAEVLTAAGLQANWQDAREALHASPETAGDFLSARCGFEPDAGLSARWREQGALHITQGFIASGEGGATCLLGRGGSDTSAALLAARLGAAAVEIWTDVPGIFSADPRTVPEARLLRHLSYSEAQELASMGARVLHPPSIQPLRQQGIPLSIKDTHRPDEPGTLISARSPHEEAQVKGVVSRENITVITMENPSMWQRAGFLADAFAVFKRHAYSVDLVSTSESTVTVSLDPQFPAHFDEVRMASILQDLEQLCRVTVHTGCTSISLVGNAIRTILGRLSAALDAFQNRHVYMVTQSANDLNLTLVVEPGHALSLVRKMHHTLIASQAESRPAFGPTWVELTRLEENP